MAIHNKAIAQSNNTNYGHKNILINGDFQVWQRGTTFTNANSNTTAYSADRWAVFRMAWTANITATQRQTQTNSKGIRIQRNSGDTSVNGLLICQAIESKEISKYAGKTITLQFKALRGSNYSAAGNTLLVQIVSGTGTDEAPTGGLTGAAFALNTSVTLNTSLTLYTATFTLPSNCNELQVMLQHVPTGTAGTNDYFEVTDIQLEEGSFATAFERRPFALELVLCQRYFELVSMGGVSPNGCTFPVTGYYASQFLPGVYLPFKTIKRAAPTVTSTNASAIRYVCNNNIVYNNTFAASDNTVHGTNIGISNAVGAVNTYGWMDNFGDILINAEL